MGRAFASEADSALLLAGHGQQRPQGDKAAFDLKVRVMKVVTRLGQHRLAQRAGILQQAADRSLGLGLADGGVGIRHRRVLDGTPQLGVELPCNRQRKFPLSSAARVQPSTSPQKIHSSPSAAPGSSSVCRMGISFCRPVISSLPAGR